MEILLIPEEGAERSKCLVNRKIQAYAYSRMTGPRNSQKHRATLKVFSGKCAQAIESFMITIPSLVLLKS